jgi:hypothetical protein
MVGFTVVVAAVLCTGIGVAALLGRRLDGVDAWEPLELATAGGVTGLFLWLAASWILAYTHLLVRPALLGVAILFGITAGFFVIRHRRSLRIQWSPGSILVLLPLLFWVGYVLWRGVVLPPANHDALAYHLPKAALLMQAHGFEQFAAADVRIVLLPWNYELLLSDILILEGGDRLTEWIGTLSYLLLLLATAAVARRWWGGGMHASLAALAVGASPVLLLNSGADKCDLLAAFLAVAAIVFASRWVVHSGRTAFALTTIALAVGAGVKPNVGAVGLAIAPFLLFRFFRELRARRVALRDLAVAGAVAAGAFLLGGVLPYFIHSRQSGGLIEVQTSARTAILQYGDWQNLWEFPYLLLTVPFSNDPNAVWVPWLKQYWFWPHYELFFSHYGKLFTLLALAMPIAILVYRRPAPDAIRRERNIATWMAFLGVAISLPVATRPVGMFAAFPRYLAFIVPFVVCWTVSPAVRQLAAHARLHRMVWGAAAAIAGFFALNAYLCAIEDRFAPLVYARWAAQNPGTRMIYFTQKRAASFVDRQAGPADTIGIDGGFDTWSYPAWGARLTRKVIVLPPGATPATIPAEVQWIVLDHSWSSLWGSTETMGDFWKTIARGPQAPEYLRLAGALTHDPHWQATYLDPRLGQAVFRRVR